MSLINDALKRAGRAQKENPPAPSPLQFRSAEPSERKGYGSTVLVLAALMVVVLGGLLVFFALQKTRTDRGSQVAHAMQPVAVPAQSQSASAPSAGTPSTAQTAGVEPTSPHSAGTPTPAVPVNATTALAQPAVAPAPAATGSETGTNPVTAPVEPPKPAVPKLQGIFYRPERPSAVVSGKTVFIGSRVGEFRVLAITQESVTLGSSTQTNVLKMEE